MLKSKCIFNFNSRVKVIEMEWRVLDTTRGICIFQSERLVNLILKAGQKHSK